MFTRKFWVATGERAMKTFAGALVATLTAGGTDLLSVGWQQALTTAGLATVVSVLMSVGSSKVGDSSSPSLLTGEK